MSSNVPRQNARFNPEEYITVSERVEKFYEKYPNGRILTNVVELNHETGFVLMQAMVYREATDTQPSATGHASEVRGDSYINKNSFVENCETGAVGRALALLGFEVKRGIASREEIEKTSRMATDKAARVSNAASTPTSTPVTTAAAPTEKSVNIDAEILQSAGALGYDAAKVRKWIDQKFKVTGGLDALGADDKREVLRVFREKASPAAKGTTK
ncbi:MAG TPA: hypothetical protein VK388_01940 [Pyrinomonadaceae bacterium]|nr:hypothetical protein [Pyrinomonadaceae bacterium]